MAGTMSSENISTKQSEIAALAGIEPGRVLTTLGPERVSGSRPTDGWDRRLSCRSGVHATAPANQGRIV